MVGREVLLRVEKKPAEPGGALLEVEDLHVRDDRGIAKVRGVSFDVRAGEIVGIAGVDGNGQTELIDALAGLQPVEAGTITVDGRDISAATPREALDAGMGHIPEDRQRRGLVLEFSISENIALHDYANAPDARMGWIFPGRMAERAKRLIRISTSWRWTVDSRGGPLRRQSAEARGGTGGRPRPKVLDSRTADART